MTVLRETILGRTIHTPHQPPVLPSPTATVRCAQPYPLAIGLGEIPPGYPAL